MENPERAPRDEAQAAELDLSTGTRDREAHPERICPNCGASLLEQKCKLLCPSRTCGYFMSCSDFL
jgi:hypothetical protein